MVRIITCKWVTQLILNKNVGTVDNNVFVLYNYIQLFYL